MTLQVDRKQCFLHNVLRVDTAMHDLSMGETAHHTSCLLKEIAIGSFISRNSGSHKPGKFCFVSALHVCLPSNTSANGPLLHLQKNFV
jgi:hypothetical protein